MIELNAAWTTFLIAILGALVPVVPVAIALIKTYLEVKTNRMRIANRPTHDEVAAAIDTKAKELLANGYNQHGND